MVRGRVSLSWCSIVLISLSRSARCDYSMMVSYYSIRPSVLALWTVCKLQVLHAQDHPDDAFREPQWFRGGVVNTSALHVRDPPIQDWEERQTSVVLVLVPTYRVIPANYCSVTSK